MKQRYSWQSRPPGAKADWKRRAHYLAYRYSQGVADYRQALALDPGHFQGNLWLAEALLPKAPAEAVALLVVLVKREPTNSQLRYRLATGLRALGKMDEARRTL